LIATAASATTKAVIRVIRMRNIALLLVVAAGHGRLGGPGAQARLLTGQFIILAVFSHPLATITSE
jgi:hypothetical protein